MAERASGDELRKSKFNLPRTLRYITAEEIQRRQQSLLQIPDFFQRGLSVDEIASELKIPKYLVDQYIRNNKLKPVGRRPGKQEKRNRTSEEVEQLFIIHSPRIIELRNKDWTLEEIGEDLQLDMPLLSKFISRLLAEGKITSRTNQMYGTNTRKYKLPPHRRRKR